MVESKEMQQVLRMNGGTGEESYANNSKLQNGCQAKSVPVLERAVLSFSVTDLSEIVTIADLGCSLGPNALFAVSEIMSIIQNKCRRLGKASPEFQVFLNDLPGNDFNTVFKSLPAFHEKLRRENGKDDRFGPCYIAGVPGSFYGRLFPSSSLNIVHSSISLHWLSQVPPELNDRATEGSINKGKIYISRSSSPAVINAYMSQFQKDFSLFLRCRAEEMIPGGPMVLTLSGRRLADPLSNENCLIWDLLAQAFQDLVSEGLIEEDELDWYNAPYYEPCAEEIRAEIEKEGSFSLDRLDTIAMPWGGINGGKKCDRLTTASKMAKAIRAIQEPMIQAHFGAEIVEPFFKRFNEIMAANTQEVEHTIVLVSMIRKA